MGHEQVKLSWREFNKGAGKTMINLLSDTNFSDVTLVCDEDKQIKAHKAILSSSSIFLKNILVQNPHQHPLLYLDFISFDHLLAIIRFVYTGETEVNEEDLEVFMKVGRRLQIQGMGGEDPNDQKGRDEKDRYTQVSTLDNDEPSLAEVDQPIIKMETEQYGQYGEELEDIKPSFEALWKLPLPPTNQDGKYPCEQCNYKTPNSYNFKKHRLNIHLGVRYTCAECEKVYTDSSALTKHKRVIHEGFKFFCNLCEHKTSTKQHLDLHKISKHGLN